MIHSIKAAASAQALLLMALALTAGNAWAEKYQARHNHRSHFHADADALTASLYAPASCDQWKHSGDAYRIAPWAKPGESHHHTGYWVGGGSAIRCLSRGRTPDEGTWGWDYVGHLIPRRVGLDWWAKPKRQGGTGSYEPDGPKLIEVKHQRE